MRAEGRCTKPRPAWGGPRKDSLAVCRGEAVLACGVGWGGRGRRWQVSGAVTLGCRAERWDCGRLGWQHDGVRAPRLVCGVLQLGSGFGVTATPAQSGP